MASKIGPIISIVVVILVLIFAAIGAVQWDSAFRWIAIAGIGLAIVAVVSFVYHYRKAGQTPTTTT
jgi:ABC-type uncharacterized transport system permease subunit